MSSAEAKLMGKAPQLLFLKNTLLDPKVEELTAQNAALKQELRSKEKSWELEKKMMQAKQQEMEEIIKTKEKELKLCNTNLLCSREINVMFQQRSLEQDKRIKKMTKEVLKKSYGKWGTEMIAKEKKAAAELQALKETYEEEKKKIKLIMTEKDQEISSVRNKNTALVTKNKKYRQELQDMNTKLQECESDCEAKTIALQQATSKVQNMADELRALQDSCKKTEVIMKAKDKEISSFKLENGELVRMRQEHRLELMDMKTKFKKCEARVNDLQETLAQETTKKEELHRKTIDIEERWLKKERDWLLWKRRMEEDMQRLTTEKKEFEELAAKTDKEKAKIKKDEEKRLKEELKEQKKQEKKEREEREKNEKRERREKEEQDKEERKERKKIEKREKKERKEQEKIEREERKQNEKRERREREMTVEE